MTGRVIGPAIDVSFIEPTVRGGASVGVLGSNALSDWISARLSGSKQRVLRLRPPGERLFKQTSSDKLVTFAATAADLASECSIILNAIKDASVLHETLLGSQDRAGVGAELQPGSVIVDCALKPPRQLQAMLGLLGMRGISVIDLAFVPHEGDVRVLVAGFPDAVDVASSTIKRLGEVVCVGALGQAHVMAALDGVRRASSDAWHVELHHLSTALGLSSSDLKTRAYLPPIASADRCIAVVADILRQRGDDINRFEHVARLRAEHVDLGGDAAIQRYGVRR